MIKCGKCKDRHETVNEVRNCYLGTNLRPDATASGLPPQPPSGAEFLAEPEAPAKAPGTDWAKKLQPVPGWELYKSLAAGLPDLERARYAVEIDGTLKFYQVDRPKEGKWAGYTFIKVQASDETWPVKALESRIKILNAILEDPRKAMLRYGHEIGACGHCGRTLTNEESRAYGIGPVCRGKMGW